MFPLIFILFCGQYFSSHFIPWQQEFHTYILLKIIVPRIHDHIKCKKVHWNNNTAAWCVVVCIHVVLCNNSISLYAISRYLQWNEMFLCMSYAVEVFIVTVLQLQYNLWLPSNNNVTTVAALSCPADCGLVCGGKSSSVFTSIEARPCWQHLHTSGFKLLVIFKDLCY